jgi:hypothetical protein
MDQILKLHPRITKLGSTYAWLSDELPIEEEKELLNRIKQLLTHLFGERLYDSIVAGVEKQMSKPTGS